MLVMLQAKVSSLYDLLCLREFAHRHESDAKLDELDIKNLFAFRHPQRPHDPPLDLTRPPHLLAVSSGSLMLTVRTLDSLTDLPSKEDL